MWLMYQALPVIMEKKLYADYFAAMPFSYYTFLKDGMTWLLNAPDQSLALILADNGYDVWIANTRGTSFSRRHVFLDPDRPEFWDWTWDEIASRDLGRIIWVVFFGFTGLLYSSMVNVVL